MNGLLVIGQKNNLDCDFSNLVAKGGLKVDYEMLSADTSGRTADGRMHIDLVSEWLKHKVTINFIPMPPAVVQSVLGQIYSYIGTGDHTIGSKTFKGIPIKFFDPKTGGTTDWIDTYIGTPSITWNTLASGIQQTNTFSISFIEL